jgi:hypothetical protein
MLESFERVLESKPKNLVQIILAEGKSGVLFVI